MDNPVFLIAAIVLGVLLVFGIVRRITKLIIITIALGLIVAGLYIARAGGYLTW